MKYILSAVFATLILANTSYATGLDENTVLLLHMNEAGNNFIDSSQNAHPVTTFGTATQTDVIQSPLTGGGNTGIFSYNGDYVSVPDSDDWYFGDGDFTVDFWYYSTGIYDRDRIMAQYEPAPNYSLIQFYQSNNLPDRLYVVFHNSNNTETVLNVTNLGLQNNTWYHVAIVRNSDNLIAFIDGIEIGRSLFVPNTVLNVSAPLTIGGDDIEINHTGHLEEFRISKGVARWTTNFTPQSSPYLNQEGLLVWFDTAVSSGDITGDGNGNSAIRRLNALRNMINAALELMDGGYIDDACQQFSSIILKTDGLSKPNDFVQGIGVSDLYSSVEQQMIDLSCVF